MFQKHAYSYIYIYMHMFLFICRYYMMCIVSLHPALLPMAPFLGVLQVSLSCLRMLEAPPAHQVPTSFSAGQGFLGKASNQTGCRGQVLCIGYLWIFVSWFCHLGYFVVWSSSFFSVQHTFHVPEPVTQGTWDVFQLTLLGGKAYWCFLYTQRILKRGYSWWNLNT